MASPASFAENFVVLIETLWNVKKDLAAILFQAEAVLIETLWNVKFLFPSEDSLLSRINRNIVECKACRYQHVLP